MQHHKLSLILNISILIFNIIKADELSIVSSSQSPQTFIQGDVGKNIFCTSNVNADSCVWRKGDFKCAFTNQGTGDQVNCKDTEDFSGSLKDNQCTLFFNKGITSDNEGSYECFFQDIDHGTASGTIDIEVLVQATVQFEGDFAANNLIQVPVDISKSVTCAVFGGVPPPHLTATLVDEEGNWFRDLHERDTEAVDENSKITKNFVLVPTREDCGKFVKCNADQGGKLSTDVQRKIEVIFKPALISDLTNPFGFKTGDETTISIIFEANPQPEVIWHRYAELSWGKKSEEKPDYIVDENAPPAPGSFNLSPGQTYENYEALPLETEGHTVTAKLLIKDAKGSDLKEGTFWLEAINSLGNQRFNFTFKEYEGIKTTEAPEIPPPTEQTMGGGTIAVIVIIVLAAVVGTGLTVWSKKNQQWCFAPPEPKQDGYEKAATVEADPPIIKDASKIPPKEENPDNPV